MTVKNKDKYVSTKPIENRVISVDKLKPHPRNYRKHPEAQIKKIRASLIRFGQVRSVVAQEGANGNYLLVAGHGLTQAAKLEGLKELRVDVIPADWTPVQVEGYLAADNVSGADDDLVALAELLQEQVNAGYSPESVGSSDAELAQMLENLANSVLDATPDFGPAGLDEQGRLDQKKKVNCPNCGHEFEPN